MVMNSETHLYFKSTQRPEFLFEQEKTKHFYVCFYFSFL